MSHAIIDRSPRGYRQLARLGALALLAACAHEPTGTQVSSHGGTKPSPLPETAALISAPTAHLITGRVYVSMVPGTEPGGDSVTITQRRGGPAVGTRMADGGFDPLAIEAEAGDTLVIAVHHETGTTNTSYGVVPIKMRPRVVRTSPTATRTDVPLNGVILVVFNEPMDGTSLSHALHLQLQGADVPGTVTEISVAGVILSAEFRPRNPLEPASLYQFSVSTDARDLSGIPLAATLQIPFTTADTSSGPTQDAAIGEISPTSAMAGSPDLTLTITGTNFGVAPDNQSLVVWWANGKTTDLATTFASSTQLTAIIPAALLSNPGIIEVFLYTGDPMGNQPLIRSNTVFFSVDAPPTPPGTGTIMVVGQINRLPPLMIPGWREVSLDGSPWQWLWEGGSVTFSPVTAGIHRLMLSNPCTAMHVPSVQSVWAMDGGTETVSVYVPPDCE